MPGTILVSVLEIVGCSLSSSTTVKVSMGKREYQTREKEDISFPLISLRDNLIIRVEDAGGAEIACAGIEARSIVEKGTWDDFFSLGNGTVHLKLQFVLSEEERSRIRTMREIAVKKKHGELLTNGIRSQEINSCNGGNLVSSPSSSYHDVSVSQESQKNHLQIEADHGKDGVQPSNHETTEHIFAAQPDSKQLNSNDADSDKKPSARLLASEAIEHSEEIYKVRNRSTPAEAVEKPFESGIASSSFKQNLTTSNHLISSNSNVKSSPSSVRKMINAFETTHSQDLSSHDKQSPATAFKLQHSKDATDREKLQYDKTNIGVDGSNPFTRTSCRIDSYLKGLNKTQSMKKNFFKTATKSKHALKRKSKDFLETFVVETTSPEYKQPQIASDHIHPCKSIADEKASGGNSVLEDKRMRHTTTVSQESCRKFRSPAETVARFKDKYSSLENSGIWIFPDGMRSLCITTGGKKVMALAESGQSEIGDKKATENGTETEVLQSKELNVVEPSKSKASEDEIPGGPFQQAIKLAIISGFGVLILLTRQRKNMFSV